MEENYKPNNVTVTHDRKPPEVVDTEESIIERLSTLVNGKEVLKRNEKPTKETND